MSDWDNVLRRLDSFVREQPKSCIVTFSVLVHDGKPLLWFEPQAQGVEPQSRIATLMSSIVNGTLTSKQK